ncbi:AP-2 complex subunit sigma [Friedmanniomyces endolithicus]|nr:AP-2 complex subunit sigma [Friedmanniomyces endolithicus]
MTFRPHLTPPRTRTPPSLHLAATVLQRRPGVESIVSCAKAPSAFTSENAAMVLSFILIQNRQGKARLAKWYAPYNDEEKIKLKGEIHRLVAPRDQKHQSNFVEFRGSSKIVYRRYAGLFFCACVDANDNELACLEAIHFFVEVLDQFFGNVCELDLVFNFYKVYAILDEVFLAGEIQETSKQVVLTRLEHLDKLE